MQQSNCNYGEKDATYLAVGEEAGVHRLVDRFYSLMEARPEYQTIWSWHSDHASSREKLSRFLSGWMGGPNDYVEKHGPINIPAAHAHLNIGYAERDQWLNCMREALESLSFDSELTEYLMGQFKIPAERIRLSAKKL